MVPIYVSILAVVFPHARLIPFWKNVSYIRVYIGGVHAAIKRRACYNALTVTMCSISFSFLLPFNRPFSRNVRALRLAEAKRGQERVRARPKKVTTKFFFLVTASRQRVMLETASIAGGATIAVFLVVIICIAAYIHCKRKQKELRSRCV